MKEKQEKALMVNVPADMKKRVKIACARGDMSLKTFVTKALEHAVEEAEARARK